MTRFVVDGMLGKVALWLRLLGYDTIYSPKDDDDRLLEIDSVGRSGSADIGRAASRES